MNTRRLPNGQFLANQYRVMLPWHYWALVGAFVLLGGIAGYYLAVLGQ